MWFKYCEHCERRIDWRLERERARTSVLGNPGSHEYYCGDCVANAFSEPEL